MASPWRDTTRNRAFPICSRVAGAAGVVVRLSRGEEDMKPVTVALAALLAACASRAVDTPREAPAPAPLDRAIVVVDQFTQPEAVRYDPAQDVYFVSNFGEGGSGATDDNGFISRMRP